MPPSEAKTQRSSKSRHGLWTGAHPLQLWLADVRSDWFGEIELIEEPKRKRRQSAHARASRERTLWENALDEALKDTFPASDPVSAEPRNARCRLFVVGSGRRARNTIGI
jgi:hypothetical protein